MNCDTAGAADDLFLSGQRYNNSNIPDTTTYNVCRFCMLLCEEDEMLRIAWSDWEHCALAAMYERVMKHKLLVAKECSEVCCNKCSVLLHQTVNALEMFRRSDDYWRKMLEVPMTATVDCQNDDLVAEYLQQKDVTLIGIEFVKIELPNEEMEFERVTSDKMEFERVTSVESEWDEEIGRIEKTNIYQEITSNYQVLEVNNLHVDEADIDQNKPVDLPNKCSICDKGFRTKIAFYRHMTVVHDIRHCMKCSFTTTGGKSSLNRHYIVEHKRTLDNIAPCKACGKVFSDPDLLLRHMNKVHVTPVASECQVCSKIFKTPFRLQMHMETVHVEPSFECDICSKMFRLKKHITWHMQSTHSKKTNDICCKCGKNFTTRGIWKKHEAKCGGEYTAQSSRNGVKCNQQPFGSGMFACSFCERKFDDHRYGRRHYRMAHPESVDGIICKLCLHYSPSKQMLDEHMSEEHANRQCSLCMRFFKSEIGLRNHQATHSTKERPFQCTLCNATFVKMNNLNYHHKRVHTTERPHKCTDCDMRFPEAGEMRAHWRHIHDVNRKVKCKWCEKRFVTLSALATHEPVHTGERKFGCKLCTESYRHLYQLSTHMRLTHPNESCD